MASEPVISLKDVRKAYGSGQARTEVLRGVSVDIDGGEFVALVGESGSGKSTLLNIIGGLDLADRGRVEVLGHVYGESAERALAAVRNRDIGFVFQAFNLLDHLSVLDNVTLPAAFSRDRAPAGPRGMEALERVGLGALSRRKPPELSGGQKQRVAIARALFNRPSLLLCDEPTGNLDSNTGREVIDFFRELNERDGVTLLVVTHEERISSAAQRVIRIQDGRIRADGEGAAAPAAARKPGEEGGDAAAADEGAETPAAGETAADRAADGSGTP